MRRAKLLLIIADVGRRGKDGFYVKCGNICIGIDVVTMTNAVIAVRMGVRDGLVMWRLGTFLSYVRVEAFNNRRHYAHAGEIENKYKCDCLHNRKYKNLNYKMHGLI